MLWAIRGAVWFVLGVVTKTVAVVVGAAVAVVVGALSIVTCGVGADCAVIDAVDFVAGPIWRLDRVLE